MNKFLNFSLGAVALAIAGCTSPPAPSWTAANPASAQAPMGTYAAAIPTLMLGTNSTMPQPGSPMPAGHVMKDPETKPAPSSSQDHSEHKAPAK